MKKSYGNYRKMPGMRVNQVHDVQCNLHARYTHSCQNTSAGK